MSRKQLLTIAAAVMMGTLLMLKAQEQPIPLSNRDRAANRFDVFRYAGDYVMENITELANGGIPDAGTACLPGRYLTTPTHMYVCAVDVNTQLPNEPLIGKWARIPLETAW